ncbi:P-loop containing nucleoside triphosphate hydrolase protein, partial [Mytilinidion resinicola]
CELHTFECRYNSRGESVTLQVGARKEINAEKPKSHDVALVLTRAFDHLKKLKSIRLEIRSPYIKTALRKVVKTYPDVMFETRGPITLYNEPRCLFHFRKELQLYSENLSDFKAKQHVDFCLKYASKTLRKDIDIYEKTMQNVGVLPGLEFLVLWMAFRPGDLIYHRQKDGKEIIVRLVSMKGELRARDDMTVDGCWHIRGERFDYAYRDGKIQQYDGYRPLTELDWYPLEYHKDRHQITQKILARGKVYLSLAGIHYRYYDGAARIYRKEANFTDDWRSRSIRHRIMIDSGEYYENISPRTLNRANISKKFDHAAVENSTLPEEDILISDVEIPGFCLATKQWGFFDVAKIQNINLSTTAFDSLVLDPAKKSIISSLVKEQVGQMSDFDDIVKGKGKGLIFMLHGEPGTGKTLTAESIADYTQRPLYTIGCGDLGTKSHNVERVLNESLALATKWKALVLVDEADVFMERRGNNELERNELVSVLLRILEYFEGIMFLTTNRIGTIDPAFKSRIHLSLSYPTLGTDARRKIWKGFVSKGSPSQSPLWLDSAFLANVAKESVNGRQIRNIVRMAYAQAANAGREIEPTDVTMGLVAHKDFEIEFSEAKDQKESSENRIIEGSPTTSVLTNLIGGGGYNLIAVWALVLILLALELEKIVGKANSSVSG